MILSNNLQMSTGGFKFERISTTIRCIVKANFRYDKQLWFVNYFIHNSSETFNRTPYIEANKVNERDATGTT